MTPELDVGFFDQFNQFYSTSQTSPFPHRLNSRYAAIVEAKKHCFVGKRVLDIASHDGRWSFAVLNAGAAHVHGIEPRKELIDSARSTFGNYGVDESRYSFDCGDVFELIRGTSFDVVLCLGFYYHTIRHAELLDLIERTGAKFVVIDTEVTPSDQVAVKSFDDPRMVFENPHEIQLFRDPVENQQMAWPDSMTRDGYTLVGRPSRAAVKFMANHFGFYCELYDWKSFLARQNEVRSLMVDYDEGWRDTFFLSRSRA